MADKTPKTKQIMDVSHPGTRSAQPSSRPIIVTHRPVLQDPMVVEKPAEKDGSEVRADHTPKTTKLKIEPIHTDVKPEEDTTSTAQLIGAPKLPVEELDDTEEKPEEAAPVSVDTPNLVAATKVEPSVKDEAVEETAEAETAPAEKTPEPEVPAAQDPVPSTEPTSEAGGDEPISEVADSLPTDDDSKPAEAPDDTDAQLADLGKPDAKTTKEAKEAAERQLALDKLIADETYFLPVDRATKRRAHRIMLIVGLVLFVIAALVAVDLLLDAGIITLAGIQPPTDFIYTQ